MQYIIAYLIWEYWYLLVAFFVIIGAVDSLEGKGDCLICVWTYPIIIMFMLSVVLQDWKSDGEKLLKLKFYSRQAFAVLFFYSVFAFLYMMGVYLPAWLILFISFLTIAIKYHEENNIPLLLLVLIVATCTCSSGRVLHEMVCMYKPGHLHEKSGEFREMVAITWISVLLFSWGYVILYVITKSLSMLLFHFTDIKSKLIDISHGRIGTIGQWTMILFACTVFYGIFTAIGYFTADIDFAEYVPTINRERFDIYDTPGYLNWLIKCAVCFIGTPIVCALTQYGLKQYIKNKSEYSNMDVIKCIGIYLTVFACCLYLHWDNYMYFMNKCTMIIPE